MADHPSLLQHDDLTLVRRLRAGDGAAFRRFFDDTFPRLYRFALRQCGDPALAEEVSQAALTTALESLNNYRGEASLLAWCYGIARHQLRRHRQQAERWQAVDDESELDALIDALRDEGDDPARELATRQLGSRVHAVLDRLPALYAEVLEGRYVLGLSVREMAQRQQRSEKAVESTLSRAREAFRSAFGAFDSGELPA